MKLLPYSELPLFYEMTEVIRKDQIQLWQANDFWTKIQIRFNVEKTNINYQNVYRYLLRLVRDGFLTIDAVKNSRGCTTYSETPEMEKYRNIFSENQDGKFKKIVVDEQISMLTEKLKSIINELTSINELADEIPALQADLNALHSKKILMIDNLKKKLTILNELKEYLN